MERGRLPWILITWMGSFRTEGSVGCLTQDIADFAILILNENFCSAFGRFWFIVLLHIGSPGREHEYCQETKYEVHTATRTCQTRYQIFKNSCLVSYFAKSLVTGVTHRPPDPLGEWPIHVYLVFMVKNAGMSGARLEEREDAMWRTLF